MEFNKSHDKRDIVKLSPSQTETWSTKDIFQTLKVNPLYSGTVREGKQVYLAGEWDGDQIDDLSDEELQEEFRLPSRINTLKRKAEYVFFLQSHFLQKNADCFSPNSGLSG